ncbi:MAG: N-6 DNA methylase [Planctomycetota bacterium]
MPQNEAPVVAVIVEQGKLLDFIDGHTQRRETPEEYVRQEIAKSLVREYRYPKSDIEVEFTVPIGTKKPRADLVVFPSGQDHAPENASLIVECKAPKVKASNKKDGVEQLKSYMVACPNVTHGMWTNGNDQHCYRRVVVSGKVKIEDVPDIPMFGQDEAAVDRPDFDDLKPATSDALLFTFRRCHNYIAGNQGLQKSQAFWELLKLIFCKIEDEHYSDQVEFYAAGNERHGTRGPQKVAKRIEGLFANVRDLYPMIFGAGEGVSLNPGVLAYLVGQLQKYSLLESDIDVKGRAYEEIVGSNLRGDRGEFFTPRNICEMAVAMLDPGEKQRVLDPACGTGGFLITAMNHVIAKITREIRERSGKNHKRANEAIKRRTDQYAKKFVFGLDFNPELVKASKMNMVMNNDGAGGLYQANSLDRPKQPFPDAVHVWPDDVQSRKLIGSIDLLFTNPPFGAKIPITEPTILEQFELGHTWTYDKEADQWHKNNTLQKSQPPEILFIERCVQFLKPGTGRMAIVLPDGILGSPGLGYVREWILRNTRVLASIDLHPDTFQPHVSIQTSVLILERKTAELIKLEQAKGQINDYEVFMAVANHVGHDKRGNHTYVRDEHGNEVFREEEHDVADWEDGVKVITTQARQVKVRDDNTKQIAQEFRKWLSEQD